MAAPLTLMTPTEALGIIGEATRGPAYITVPATGKVVDPSDSRADQDSKDEDETVRCQESKANEPSVLPTIKINRKPSPVE